MHYLILILIVSIWALILLLILHSPKSLKGILSIIKHHPIEHHYLVEELFNKFIENPEHFTVDEYHLTYRDTNYPRVWAANTIINRTFVNPYGSNCIVNVEQESARLSIYDKVLLDRIIQASKIIREDIIKRIPTIRSAL